MGEIINAYNILDNINIHSGERKCNVVKWIHLGQEYFMFASREDALQVDVNMTN
jgi:hypothetical protein